MKVFTVLTARNIRFDFEFREDILSGLCVAQVLWVCFVFDFSRMRKSCLKTIVALSTKCHVLQGKKITTSLLYRNIRNHLKKFWPRILVLCSLRTV